MQLGTTMLQAVDLLRQPDSWRPLRPSGCKLACWAELYRHRRPLVMVAYFFVFAERAVR
jgi:hypothetical protein